MITCQFNKCRHNDKGICGKFQDAVLDDRGGCILADRQEDGPDDPPWLIKVLCELRKTEGYVFNYDKDRRFILELRMDYPSVDLIDAVKAWRTHLLDNPPQKKRPNYRSRLRRWCVNTVRFGKEKGELKRWNPEKIQGSKDQSIITDKDRCPKCGKKMKIFRATIDCKPGYKDYKVYDCDCFCKRGKDN